MDSAKTEYLKILLPKLVRSGRKIITFSQFSSFLHLIQRKLHKLGLTSLLLDGQTSNREETIACFQSESDVPILLASIRVGGVGLNLTAADCCVLMEPWWNPSVEAQAIDRIHRIGQKKSIDVYRLYCNDSIEEKIVSLTHTFSGRAKNMNATTFMEKNDIGCCPAKKTRWY